MSSELKEAQNFEDNNRSAYYMTEEEETSECEYIYEEEIPVLIVIN